MISNDELVYQKVTWQSVVPKVMLNGFPKAGLHMAEQMISPIANPVRTIWSRGGWVGNTGGNGFWNTTNEQVGEHERYELISLCLPGQYYKSHAVYQQVYSNFINMCGYGMIFMYRDLRDVAVSWAHHILNSNRASLHPAKQYFKLLEKDGGFEDVLVAVISGAGPLPGIIEHWEEFAPWLDEDWVLSVRYEDMRNEPEMVAERIFRYFVDRSQEVRLTDLEIAAVAKLKFQEMAAATRRRQASPTFRKGKVGGWKEEFTPTAAEVFRDHGGNKWIEKLGYQEEQ